MGERVKKLFKVFSWESQFSDLWSQRVKISGSWLRGDNLGQMWTMLWSFYLSYTMLFINLMEPKNKSNISKLFHDLSLWLAKILALSNQPIRDKNSNLISCSLQWPKLVSFFVFLWSFFSNFLHIEEMYNGFCVYIRLCKHRNHFTFLL